MSARVIIVGGGLAGGLSALALHAKQPDVDLCIVEREPVLGGNHVWSFFDGDVAARDGWVLDGLPRYRWPAHTVRFPKRSRQLPLGYNSVRSADFHRFLIDRLPAGTIRTGCAIESVGEDGVVLSTGERMRADAVIDARGLGGLGDLRVGWQKFVGRHVRCARPHGQALPTIMDARVDQSDGYRFVYVLPFGDRDMLIEDTYYTTEPDLQVERLGGRIEDYASGQGWQIEAILNEETGVLPIVIDGTAASLWAGSRVPLIGLRGGFFHPTTGYSLPDAVANAALLADQRDLRTAPLHRLFQDRAERLWARGGFYRLLNRMLFDAAEPAERYRVLEHFYRLSPHRIARFYAGGLNALDKLRILSGRPPVPIGRAVKAIWGTA